MTHEAYKTDLMPGDVSIPVHAIRHLMEEASIRMPADFAANLEGMRAVEVEDESIKFGLIMDLFSEASDPIKDDLAQIAQNFILERVNAEKPEEQITLPSINAAFIKIIRKKLDHPDVTSTERAEVLGATKSVHEPILKAERHIAALDPVAFKNTSKLSWELIINGVKSKSPDLAVIVGR